MKESKGDAIRIVNYVLRMPSNKRLDFEAVKRIALVYVDELLSTLDKDDVEILYWVEVEQELEDLEDI